MPDGSLKVNILKSFDTTRVEAGLAAGAGQRGAFVNQHPELRAKVAGHTDSTGALAHNQTLASVNRAKSVTDYLAASVRRPRMSTEGRGPNDPIGDNAR